MLHKVSLLALAASCSTPVRGASWESRAPYDAAGFAAPAPDGSIFAGDSEFASDAEIARALDYAYDPGAIRSVALLPFGQVGRELVGSEEAVFAHLEQANPGLRRVRIPAALLPRNVAAGHLRSLAARLQADTVLLYEIRRHSTYDERVFSRDRATFRVTLEDYLFDVRSGIVPHSNAFDHVVESKRDAGEDLTAYVDENFRAITTELVARMAQDLRTLRGDGVR